MISYSLALSLFGFKQMQNVLAPGERGQRRNPATKAFDSVTQATTDQFGSTLRSAFAAGDNVQRGLVGLTFGLLFPWTGSSNRSRNRNGVANNDRAEDAR